MKILYYCFALLPFSLSAQLNIGSSGGDFSNNAGSISFTVGQTMTNHIEDFPLTINEGVQQPYEYYSLEIDQLNTFFFEYFPNPTQGILNLKGDQISGSTLHLFDLNGRLVREDKLQETTHTLDLTNLPPGVYTLEISTSQYKNAIKIIKH